MSRTRSPRRRPRSARRAFPSRWRLVSSTACSALALVAAGCGGDDGGANPQQAQASAPELPSDLGASLAAQADELAALLVDGDVEGARARATELRENVVRAIDSGDVAPALGRRILVALDRLLAALPIPEETVVEPAEEDKGKEDEKKEKDEEEQVEEPEEETTEETTEETDEDPGQGDENGGGNGNGNGNDG